MRNVAIVLAGGSGSRMKSNIKKQYLLIGEYPVLWYSLRVFQDFAGIDEIVLVCGRGEVEQCRREFVERYGFTKIGQIVEGGRERYHSVYEGLKAAEHSDYVLIHDGARPFIDTDILTRIFAALSDCPACAVGMPVKDTIKMRDEDGFAKQTLPRDKLWMIQTPQAFSYRLIRQAYDGLFCRGQADQAAEDRDGRKMDGRSRETVQITDDAMVVEYILHIPVKLIEGSYENIKITTPEDLPVAETLIKRRTAENRFEKMH